MYKIHQKCKQFKLRMNELKIQNKLSIQEYKTYIQKYQKEISMIIQDQD